MIIKKYGIPLATCLTLYAIIFWQDTAHALVADTAVLLQMAATQIEQKLNLAAILLQAEQTVQHLQEVSETTQQVYRGINEVININPEILKQHALKIYYKSAIAQKIPHLQRHIQSIRDLHNIDQNTLFEIRDKVLNHAYGAGLAELKSAYDNREAAATAWLRKLDFQTLHQVELKDMYSLEDACLKGNGACAAAAAKAQIKTAQFAAHMHETALLQVESLSRQIANTDRQEIKKIQEFDRFAKDFINMTQDKIISQGRQYVH